MLRISWRYKAKNTGMLNRIALKEPQFYKNIARLKMAYARTNEVYLPMNGMNNDYLPVKAEAHQSWLP